MAEYIEREALIHSVTSQKVQEMLRGDIAYRLSCGRNHADWSNGFECGMQQAINIIAAADVVEVRHGEWVRVVDDVRRCYWYVCSVCGQDPPRNDWGHEYHSAYCPHCGAKMDGKGEGE